MWKDLTAVRRSKAVVLPMLLVPLLLLRPPAGRASGSQPVPSTNVNIDGFLGRLPGDVAAPDPRAPGARAARRARERLPLGSAVPDRAAHGVGGARRRRVRGREGAQDASKALLHLPISDRDLFLAKLLGAFVPAVVVSWLGFLCFAIVTNTIAWPVMHRALHPDAPVGRDDPVGRAGSRGARARASWCVCPPGRTVAGGQPARRRGDPPADLPRASARPRACCSSTFPVAIDGRRGAVAARHLARARRHREVQPGPHRAACVTLDQREARTSCSTLAKKDHREEDGEDDRRSSSSPVNVTAGAARRAPLRHPRDDERTSVPAATRKSSAAER